MRGEASFRSKGEGGRLARLFDNAGGDLDAIAILNGGRTDPNFFYLSGYTSGLFEGSALFLFHDGHIEVLTNALEEEAARLKEYEVHVDRNAGSPAWRGALASSILRGCTTVGVNFAGLSHSDYLGLAGALGAKELVDVSGALSATRLVKDRDELEALSEAAAVISRVADSVPPMLEEGLTERELKAMIDYRIVSEGASSPSFESIVAFGADSALPHFTPGERRLRKGDAVLVDVGARCRLYCSDITRTFFYGSPPRALREAYSTVLEAQEQAIETLREGETGAAVHAAASRVIEGSRFRGRFTHGLGHSLGVEVHDGPGLSPRNRAKLLRDMVMTVEPGVYLRGKGGVRIEDDVVVTEDSCRLLTTAKKELTVV